MTTIESHHLNARRVEAPHEVRDEDLYAELVESMNRDGWQGAPIVVVDREGGDPLAVTGSHRIAAAREAYLLVPAVYLEDLAAPYGIDVKQLISASEAYDLDETTAIFQAASRAAELLPANIVDYYGLDIH